VDFDLVGELFVFVASAFSSRVGPPGPLSLSLVQRVELICRTAARSGVEVN
jgi:hypothetical protein